MLRDERRGGGFARKTHVILGLLAVAMLSVAASLNPKSPLTFALRATGRHSDSYSRATSSRPEPHLLVEPPQELVNTTSVDHNISLALGTSTCPSGHFGRDCKHGLKTFYFEHDVYHGFQPLKDAKLSGWSPDKGFYERIVAKVSAKLIVEVGVWRGLSLVHLASSMKELMGGGAVIAVDTWLGAPEFWNRKSTAGAPDNERDLKWKYGYPQVYYDFLSNVVTHRLEDVVIPLPVPSLIAAQLLQEKDAVADIIHIDAAHEYESVREDINSWFPLLSDDGILLGDDFDEHWPGVVKAACEFAHTIAVQVYCSGNKWWIKKTEALMNATIPAESVESCVSKAYSSQCKD